MSSRNATVAIVSIATIFLLSCALLQRSTGDGVVMSRATAANSPRAAAPAFAPERVAATKAAMPTAPAADSCEDSLRGTQVDGAVHLDANERPLADRDLRRLFDYFLARLGEREPATIRADLLAYLRDTLHLDADSQRSLLEWFDRYVDVQRAQVTMSRSGDIAIEVARLRALHREYLGEALADAWFGADDAYAAYTAARMTVARDATLNPEEKVRRLAENEAGLDPLARENLHATTDFQVAVAQTAQLDAADADAIARHADRAALWGEEAAARLDALDQAQAQWTARAADYARAREALLADATLPTGVRDARLAGLLTGFSVPEQRRLLSLAQANALPGR